MHSVGVNDTTPGGPYIQCACNGGSGSAQGGAYALAIAGMFSGATGTFPISGTAYLEVWENSVRLSGPHTQGTSQIGTIDNNGKFTIRYSMYGSLNTLIGVVRDGRVTGTYTISDHSGSAVISGNRRQ